MRDGVFTPSDIVRLSFVEPTDWAMSIQDTRDCLRDLQVIATVPHLSEEQIRELVKKKLILRKDNAGGIWLTQLGVYTKTGHV